MAMLERIQGRIEFYKSAQVFSPNKIALDDLIWMESKLRKLLRRDSVQVKFDWTKKTAILNPPKWENPYEGQI